MSFLNNSDSCQGSSNPVNKFIETTDSSDYRTIHRDFQQPSHHNVLHQFNQRDQNIENEFQQFKGAHYDDLNSYAVDPYRGANPLNVNQVQHGNSTQNWANDFNKMTLNDQNINQQHLPANGIQQNTINIQRPQQVPNSMNSMYRSQFHSTQQEHMLQSESPMFDTQMMNNDQQRMEVNQFQELDSEFDSAFTEVETELTSQNVSEEMEVSRDNHHGEVTTSKIPQEVIINDEDKIKFAVLAKNVFNIMNNTPKGISSATSDKFKQSNFMQLMNKISTREIEVSNDKKKLVDQNGMDIRSELADPLQNIRSDELLESSFESAIKVAQSNSIKVDADSWQGEFV